MNIVHFGGAKGVGKTTSLQYLRKDLEKKQDIGIFFSSVELNAISTSTFGKTLRQLTSVEVKEAQNLLFHQIKNSNYQTVLLDSHYVDVVHNKVIALTPTEHALQFNCHILLEATSHTILNRRINDDRTDRLLDLTAIVTEINEERNEALKLAKRNAARIYIVNAEREASGIAMVIKGILRDEFNV